jgi:hypothetical protein
LRAENARLLRLLKLTQAQAAPPETRTGRVLRGATGAGPCGSPAAAKVALFGALFAARTDVHAVRWENARSRSGIGAHAWVFFAGPVPAQTARRLGTALLREAMALRGQLDLASYDRLFPSQDVLPAGGMGNLIAAPLHGRPRRDGATVFLDLATLEPHEDQRAFLSTLSRMSPREVTRTRCSTSGSACARRPGARPGSSGASTRPLTADLSCPGASPTP